MPPLHEQQRSLIDAYFSGRISCEDSVVLHQHVPDCPECRAYYERHQLLAQLDPAAASAKARMRASLGLRPPRVSLFLVPSLGAATVALLAVFGVAYWHAPSEFRARGQPSPAAQPQLQVYRISIDRPPVPLGATMAPGDELAFAYADAAGFSHLLIFGVDAENRIRWYSPTWRDPRDNPVSPSVDPSPGLHELPAAVAHPLALGRLRLYAVFLRSPVSVRDLEAKVSGVPEPESALQQLAAGWMRWNVQVVSAPPP